MQAIQSGSNALYLLFGLNLDRILFLGAVVAALLIAGVFISAETTAQVII